LGGGGGVCLIQGLSGGTGNHCLNTTPPYNSKREKTRKTHQPQKKGPRGALVSKGEKRVITLHGVSAELKKNRRLQELPYRVKNSSASVDKVELPDTMSFLSVTRGDHRPAFSRRLCQGFLVSTCRDSLKKKKGLKRSRTGML